MNRREHLALPLLTLLAGTSQAQAPEAKPQGLDEAAQRALVEQYTAAGNRMMRAGSTAADVEAWFALCTPDFEYVHAGYGGRYSRAELHGNALRNQERGRYQQTADRYRIEQVLPGWNAAAVLRLEQASGKRHLSLFEFKDGLISRITEYWR